MMSDADCTTGREPRSVAASFTSLNYKIDDSNNYALQCLDAIGCLYKPISIIPKTLYCGIRPYWIRYDTTRYYTIMCTQYVTYSISLICRIGQINNRVMG